MLTQNGPMARFVEDLGLLLPIICGPDWRDPTVVPVPLGDPSDVEIQNLRIAVHTDNGILKPIAAIREAVNTAAKTLSDAGLAVEEARPRSLEQSHALFANLLAADGRAWVQRLLAKAGTKEAHPWLASRISAAKVLSVAEFTELLEEVDRYRSEMLAFMEHYDVILCPVNALPALPHDTGMEEFRRGAFSYTAAYNLTGWPGAVVRGGTSSEGLPIGVQVVARPWREDVALAVVQYLERALGGWRRPSL